MCGIMGAVAGYDVVPMLLAGLKKLEYRGYDSAGILVQQEAKLIRRRVVGRVSGLQELIEADPLQGSVGIAHTRWATHGDPSLLNAHPHWSHEQVAVVHNGIIENYQVLRDKLSALGFHFETATDTEVIAHLIYHESQEERDPLKALAQTVEQLEGAYALAIVFRDHPERLYVIRRGSPLLLGLSPGAHWVASDQLALKGLAREVIALEEGDMALLTAHHLVIYDAQGALAVREQRILPAAKTEGNGRGQYRHFMQKEIFEQDQSLSETFEYLESMKADWLSGFRPENIHIVACGSSYHAGWAARYYFEQAGIATQVEVASEYRYRDIVVNPKTLLIAISQSGETADTLAALRLARTLGYQEIWSIVNVPGSAMTRLSDQVIYTQAGVEVGVASTKAFTTQLLVLLFLSALWRDEGGEAEFKHLPVVIQSLFGVEERIQNWAVDFADKHHALFLGRGVFLPIAEEGALKLKEISYIHAEAYPAGELKHGPLALVDKDMPVLVLAPQNDLLVKLKSNLEEVRARGGQLYVLSDDPAVLADGAFRSIQIPKTTPLLAPIVYTIPLQLLAYHVALVRGTDVDCPRNLAKSVTVE